VERPKEHNMPVHEDLPVVYHQQDTNYYCGAACAQMVLAQIGAGLLDQAGLYTDNHDHSVIEPGWYTAPDGLNWTLNNRRPASFTNWFVTFALANEDAISRKIAWTIHHYQVAPVAMVYGSAHWIVVRGYEASAAPTGSTDTSYSITSLDINNPWPPTPSTPPPPPHNGSDGCGTGGDRGIADEHVAYATWQDTYMTGVPSGYWGGKFVAVCDPEPPADRIGQQAAPPSRLKGEKLLTPKEAGSRALAGLKSYRLYDRNSWQKTLAKVSPGAPVLVQRLDRLDTFYYIVPMHAGKKAAPALVAVDARFGDYRQALVLRDSRANALAGLSFDAETALHKVLGRKIELGERQGQLLIRKEAYCLYPTLVWKPCRESLSPYYPFHMVTVGDRRIYVRVDGQVFTELHDQDRGI
jgi:hypothetical protein